MTSNEDASLTQPSLSFVYLFAFCNIFTFLTLLTSYSSFLDQSSFPSFLRPSSSCSGNNGCQPAETNTTCKQRVQLDRKGASAFCLFSSFPLFLAAFCRYSHCFLKQCFPLLNAQRKQSIKYKPPVALHVHGCLPSECY